MNVNRQQQQFPQQMQQQRNFGGGGIQQQSATTLLKAIHEHHNAIYNIMSAEQKSQVDAIEAKPHLSRTQEDVNELYACLGVVCG